MALLPTPSKNKLPRPWILADVKTFPPTARIVTAITKTRMRPLLSYRIAIVMPVLQIANLGSIVRMVVEEEVSVLHYDMCMRTIYISC